VLTRKKLMVCASLAVMLLLTILYTNRLRIVFYLMTPRHEFKMTNVPPAPDYRLSKNWHSLPKNRSSEKIDVFFLHPTTLRSPKYWNEDLMKEAEPDKLKWVEENITNVFDECCRLYTPYFRQATLAAYWDNENGPLARQVAYEDVLAAFDHYISVHNPTDPFILAGHSQGSEMGIRLIQDRILNTPLHSRLIAAHIIGIAIPSLEMAQTHSTLEVCQSAEQTGCLINWTTFRREANEDYFRLGPNGWWTKDGYVVDSFSKYVCVNPLSWHSDQELIEKDQHQGALIQQADNSHMSLVKATSAQCGFDGLKVDSLDQYMPLNLKGNYHMYDYAIFFENIRSNLALRIQAHQK